MSRLFKGISILLIVTLLMHTMPINTLAEEYRNSTEALQTDNITTMQAEVPDDPYITGEIVEKPINNLEDENSNTTEAIQIDDITSVQTEPAEEPYIIGEIEEKRERDIKYFLRSDFTYEAAIYPNAVHYFENNQWHEINNTLVEENLDSESVLTNKKNSYSIKLAKNTRSEKLVRVIKDKYELSWNLEGSNHSIVESILKDNKHTESLNENEKKKLVKDLTSAVTYRDVFNHVDLEYVVLPEEVKENIILKNVPDVLEFTFNLSVKNLIAVKNEDGSVSFASLDSGEIIFTIQPPYMYDSEDGYSTNISVELIEQKNGYKLTIIPDREWLENKERIYPVIIDPIVKTSNTKSLIRDAHVSEGLPTTNYYRFTILKTGYGSSSKRNRSYIKFNGMPALNSGDMIVGAYLNVATETYANNSQVNVHRVTSTWESETITWNNKASYDSKIEDYQIVNSTGHWYTWDITGVVKDWYIGKYPNYGVMLKAENETSGYTHYYSSDVVLYPELRPSITIVYINNTGLEDYWTYRTHSVGRAGTGYVNDFNGNLVFVHNTITGSGNRMPVNINHVYNSNDSTTDIGYGAGWRTNYDQQILPKSIEGVDYLEYTDGDGTKHYFTYNSTDQVWKDETGKDLTIRVVSPYRILEDKSRNKLYFHMSGSLAGKLYKIEDSNGNVAQVYYNSNNRISYIKDGTQRNTNFTYNTSNKLTGITDINGRTTTFQYGSNNRLWRIIYPDGKITEFGIHPTDFISVKNHDGYKIDYTYTTSSPKRVISIKESAMDGTLGQKLDITYNHTETIFKDLKNREITYQFNYYGNTVSTKDSMGHGGYYDYQKVGTGDNNHRNRLTAESKPQKTIINLLKNPNMEYTSDWTLGEWFGSTGTGGYTTEEKYAGNKSLKLSKTNTDGTQYYIQTLNLEKGKTYTLSGYVKTNNITSVAGYGAVLIARYVDATGAQPIVKSRYVKGNTSWQRIELTFTIPSDAASTNVWIRVAIEGETGTAYFDCLQLEEGATVNRYNLLENPDFTLGSDNIPLFWSKSSTCNSNDRWVDIGSGHVSGLHQYGFCIVGSASNEKYLRQSLDLTGGKGDVFTVGGWAKADSAPITEGSNREFAIRVKILYNDGSTQTEYIRFNPDVSNWQFASGQIIAQNGSYNKIQVDLVYARNVNIVYFDGIGLYKEQFSQSYTYDDNGNIISVTDLVNNKSRFEYNGNNDLTKMITPRGGSYTYDYDSKHNLKKATTPTGIEYSFTYDSYGNVISTKTGKDTLFIESSAEYTADGNFLRKVKDSRGNSVVYDTDPLTGLLRSVTDARGNKTDYSYDIMDRITSVSATNGDTIATINYTYNGDYLSSISHNGFEYVFDYDGFGNTESISIGDTSLISYEYEPNNGRLTKSLYGNNDYVEYSYDDLDRIIGIKYNGTEKFTYNYTSSGMIGYHKDLVNNESYHYEYDLSDRLSQIVNSKGETTGFYYDLCNNVNQIKEFVDGRTYITNYEYDQDNKPTKTEFANINHQYNYDSLGRISNEKIWNTSTSLNYTKNYSYVPGQDGSTTGLIAAISDGMDNIAYEYDGNCSIISIIHNGKRIDYEYDALNQLTRENNQVLNKTITYEYDSGGNILYKREYAYTTGTLPGTALDTVEYKYDSEWKDLLISYDGSPITYDQIGNPLSYRGWTLTWAHGNQLKSMTGNGKTISYKYNDSGIRTEKNINGTVTKYHLVGDRVTYETNGIDKIYYYYNGNGILTSMEYNGVKYLYLRNAQGDITGLLDENGNKVVTYTYDTWGKLVSITGSLASTVGEKNPYRYRGYRYDTETGFYLAGVRYYDPVVGRWISPEPNVYEGGFDENAGMLAFNVYAYCANNPVNYSDSTGQGIVAAIVIGVIAGAAIGAGASYVKYKQVKVTWIAGGAIIGGLLAAGGYWVYTTYMGALATWTAYKAAMIASGAGTTSAALGRMFEKFYYGYYKIAAKFQQVIWRGFRFDAIFKNRIIELKNFNWSNYSVAQLKSIANQFVKQALNYMSAIGNEIAGQKIQGITFYFSSKPPQIIIDALKRIGVLVDWLR